MQKHNISKRKLPMCTRLCVFCGSTPNICLTVAYKLNAYVENSDSESQFSFW